MASVDLDEIEAKLAARARKTSKQRGPYTTQFVKCPAYLIDTPNKTIREVIYDGRIETIYDFLGFECYEFREIMLNARRDCLYIDANALYTAQTNMAIRSVLFSHIRYHSTLIGRGLVIGHNEEGDTQAPHMSIENLKGEIRWES